MANPNDLVRDAILRHLYQVHSKARSPKTAGLMIRKLERDLRAQGFKQQEVGSNLDYLIQKGWVREVIEYRPFTTPAGITRQAERRWYKISDIGIDLIEAGPVHPRPPAVHHIDLSKVGGVTVIAEGIVVNASFTDFWRGLHELREAVLADPELTDERKLEIAADIESLQAQLQKLHPDSSVARILWSGIERAASAAGLTDLAGRLSELIRPLVS